MYEITFVLALCRGDEFRLKVPEENFVLVCNNIDNVFVES